MVSLREHSGGNYEKLISMKEIDFKKGFVVKEKHFLEAKTRVKPSPCLSPKMYIDWDQKFGSS